VGIVGGGVAGLCCALELARHGARSVVFDTGEHGAGGRLATRAAGDGSLRAAAAGSALAPPAGLVFDHGAQFFTASDPGFAEAVAAWESAGAVAQWAGAVGDLRGGAFSPQPSPAGPRFVGVGGMRRLAEHLAAEAEATGLVEVRRPRWVNGARAAGGRWRLTARGKDEGSYDAVVIAHNGKCANRLSAPMGVPAVAAQLRRLKLSAVWVLMAAFEAPLAAPGGLEGAFVRDSDVLAWAANNSAKLHLPAGAPQCWTLVSTPLYGRANKVPQESVPPEAAARVTAEMLGAWERALGFPPGALPAAVHTRAQLWGAALPVNSPRVPCIWDAQGRVGVAGDWVNGGGSVQAAALSGQALARSICSMRGRGPEEADALSEGLAAPFKPAGGESIGQFPRRPAAAAAAAAASR
jgi:predicted NAD/FAD-dependent oxidoreductase